MSARLWRQTGGIIVKFLTVAMAMLLATVSGANDHPLTAAPASTALTPVRPAGGGV